MELIFIGVGLALVVWLFLLQPPDRSGQREV